MLRQRLFRATVWLIALTLLSAIPSGFAANARAAEVTGNTYTSPQFSYTVTWDSSWFVVEETSETYDQLVLTNGVTIATITGVEAYGGSASFAVLGFITSTSQ